MSAAHGPVVVDLDGPADESLRECADVLYRALGVLSTAHAVRSAWQALARYPGCALVVVRDEGGRCVTVTRARVHGEAEFRVHRAPEGELPLWAVELYQRLVEISRPGPRTVTASRRVASTGSPRGARRSR